MRMNEEQRGRVRLADFHRLQLRRAIKQANYAMSGKTRSWIESVLVCYLFEAISWLGLGAECGFFPPDDAKQVLGMYHTLLKESVAFYQEGNFSMFTPGLEQYIFRLASDPNLTATDIGNPSRAENDRVLFGAALLMSNRLLKDQLVELAALMVTFMPQVESEKILRGQLDVKAVEELLSGEDSQ